MRPPESKDRPIRQAQGRPKKAAGKIEIVSRQDAVKCPPQAVRDVVRVVLTEERRQAELSIAIIGDEEMTALNLRYLHRDRPTDVLAFPYGQEGGRVSGEVVVNADQAVREAATRSHSAEDELMLYVVHGVLHILGYDDGKAAEAKRMHRRERELLRAAGRIVES